MSQSKAISRFPVPAFEELPQDLQDTFLGFKEKLGFTPNFMKALAHRPEELRGFLTYYNALVAKESDTLTAAEKEMAIVAHSSYNGCSYCVQSHGAVLRVVTENPQIADQVAVNYHEADITAREKAIIDFSMKLTTDSRKVDENDYKALEEHGLTREDIWDLAGVVGIFNFSNRMMNFLAVRPDDEFYSMGR
ncbi:peroxidase-related enzyme [Vibrio sp. JC009]|uniref:peroxidase-related enzyme n=1 Tax=Vibrio sp. JC009 TaxID=2912314 RepID=UPI0023B1F27C|nr:peroxidase-related enzyme [Vibrio sp. JC009]WED23730.1 peroxidase-related enzyme [Vibrio sp. JC009]